MICPASSVVERLLCRQRVGGSNPSPGSMTSPATTAANNLPPASVVMAQRNCRRPTIRNASDGGSFIASGGTLR